ncbi:MAG: hypothetical protein ACJ8GO_13275 [Ramlibacter sp.]
MSRNRFLAAAASLALVAAAGCSAGPLVGSAIVLQGTLVIQGNEPVTTPVLITQGQGRWELQGAEPSRVRELQNRQVQATGIVTRRDPGGAQLPALRVSEIAPRP